MEILDDVIKKLSDAADYTIKGAEKLTDAAKQKLAIADEESKLRKLYAVLGKRYFDEQIADGCVPAEHAETFGEIKAKKQKIAELKAEQQAAKEGCIICPHCKSKVAKDDSYCKVCGLKQ